MLSPAVHDHGDGPRSDIIDATADKRKPMILESGDIRRIIRSAIEPWLHVVLIRRMDIGEVVGHQRSHVAREDLGRDRWLLAPARCEDGNAAA